MTRPTLQILGCAVCIGAFVACTSSDDPYSESPYKYDDLAITSFRLKADDSVMANLDTVFFSIDLDRGRIYNPDSLPKGTRISRLIISPTLPPNLSKAELTYMTSATTDTTIEYTTSSTDTINFELGAARLKLTSLQTAQEYTYVIEVNVHKMEPDSLYWNASAKRGLPAPGRIDAQRTVDLADGRLVSVQTGADGKNYISVTDDPTLEVWETREVRLPDGARLNTLAGGTDCLYIVSGGHLWKAGAEGSDWTDTGAQMDYIYGTYDNRTTVLGVRRDASTGTMMHTRYPADPSKPDKAVAPGCPVEATSQLFEYSTEWAVEPLTMMAGGVTADGSCAGSVWAFDGTEWAQISMSALPEASGMTMLMYTTFTIDDALIARSHPTMLLFGGIDAEGNGMRTVYTSADYGVHWSRGGDLLQLPEYIATRYDAQAFVRKITLDYPVAGRSGSAWNTGYASRPLPGWLSIAGYAPSSRVTSAPTDWECPYIYLVGGNAPAGGRLYDEIWRGVINRLSFAPLY